MNQFSGSGKILFTHNTTDLSTCATVCDATPACVGFSYLSVRSKSCILRSSIMIFHASPSSLWTMFVLMEPNHAVLNYFSYQQEGYVGCFIDDKKNPILPNMMVIDTKINIGAGVLQACYVHANARGEPLWAVQNGNECRSGPISSKITQYGPMQDESNCNYSCGLPVKGGNPINTLEAKCGAASFSSVYKITVLFLLLNLYDA